MIMPSKQPPPQKRAKAAPKPASKKPAAKPGAKPAAKKPAPKGVGKVSSGPVPAMETPALRKKMQEEEAKWRAESDLRTLQEAEQIRADRNRLGNAKRVADAQLKALDSISRAMK